MLQLPNTWPLAFYATEAAVSYLVLFAIYRLFFHRIAHIPGPRLAAFTYYYQAYYDVSPHKGQWLFHQIALHKKYGPVVRVGPDEVHIDDSEFYTDFAGSAKTRRNKSRTWYWFSSNESFIGLSSFATLEHGQHRLRRQAMDPFFSMRKVRDLEGRIRGHVEKMRDVVLGWGKEGREGDLMVATSALTLDVIAEYSFGKSTGALDSPDLGAPMRKLFEQGVQIHPLARAFPTLVFVMMSMMQFFSKISPTINAQANFNKLSDEIIRPIYKKASEGDADLDESVVQALTQNKSLPPHERTFNRVNGEALNLIGAGTETTGRTLAVSFFYILNDPSIHRRLLAELRTVMPTATSPLPPVTTLSRLPYLTAVIHESTRLAHGVAGRLVRISPDGPIHTNGYTIPAGSTFSVSHYLHHTNPEKFPAPTRFEPERYTGEKGAETLKYLVPFGKGPRMCLGMNLAWSEMYLSIAALIGSVKMELFETRVRDVTVDREYFLGLFPADSKGIRVKVLGLQDDA